VLEDVPAAPSPDFETQEASLPDRVTLVFDPIRYDIDTREALLPVRLKNVSDDALYPPFRVEIKELVHPYSVKAGTETSVPTILNSSNGDTGVGAIFDYSDALGDLESLEPDAVTDAILWRLEAASPVKTDFYIGAEITGFVEQGRAR